VPVVGDPFRFVTLFGQRVESSLAGIVGDDLPVWVRTLREGEVRPGENPPKKLSPNPQFLAGKYVWGGFVAPHPGHFVGEQATRLLIPSLEHPDAKVLFVIQGTRQNKHPDVASLPKWFWDITSWYGVGRERMVFLDAPAVVEELIVYPQAEYLHDGAPTSEYLDVLDANWVAKGLAAIESDVLYVSRAANAHRFSGERYLEKLLAASGVTVIRPEVLNDEHLKMRYFAGAKHIVINHGSAVLFRNMLGRVPGQRITQLVRGQVLNQDEGVGYFSEPLAPRIEQLDYVDLSRGFIVGPYFDAPGKRHDQLGIKPAQLTSKDKTIDFFRGLGVELANKWDDRALAAAEREMVTDFHRWAIHSYPQLDPLRITQNIRTSLEANKDGILPGPEITEALVPVAELHNLKDIRTSANRLDALLDRKTGFVAGMLKQAPSFRSWLSDVGK